MREKKPFLLRLSPQLLEEIQRMAEEEFRSVNGQIEYMLREAVLKRRRTRLVEEEEEGEEQK